MFLYVNIKHNFTCVRTKSYNMHGGSGMYLYTPSLEHVFHKYAPPPQRVLILQDLGISSSWKKWV